MKIIFIPIDQTGYFNERELARTNIIQDLTNEQTLGSDAKEFKFHILYFLDSAALKSKLPNRVADAISKVEGFR